MLAIRITRPFSALKSFFEKLDSFCNKLIVYEHTEAARPHVHGLIVDCKPTTDTLKNWIRDAVGKVDKSDWSFVSKNVNEQFITYMSKGKLAPSIAKGYTEEQVEAYTLAWENRPKQKVQARLTYVVKETPDERKMRQSDMVDEICRRCQEDKSPQHIIQTIYRVVAVENRNVIGRYKVRDYYDVVMGRLEPRVWIADMVAMCAFNPHK